MGQGKILLEEAQGSHSLRLGSAKVQIRADKDHQGFKAETVRVGAIKANPWQTIQLPFKECQRETEQPVQLFWSFN